MKHTFVSKNKCDQVFYLFNVQSYAIRQQIIKIPKCFQQMNEKNLFSSKNVS